ncbi:MAG: type II secretion system F family protein [Azoarcus sp.]|jgi:general secretion pathway protein F|nr:type II secretion system F family protein [Azoarcus sp.]
MPEFAWRAAKADGSIQEGKAVAASREAVSRQLLGQGMTPLKVVEAAPPSQAGRAAPGFAETAAPAFHGRDKGVTGVDIHVLTNELAVMLRAGLPLDRALRVLISMAPRPSVGALLEDVFKSVKAGKGLSQALAPHQALFGDFYINMVRSGEAGGQLAEVLSRLAEHLERIKALRESVVSALIYPAILVLVALISVFMMLGFVVPQFESLFNDMGEALPLPTRIIVAVGHFFSDWWWGLALGAAALVAGLRQWLSSPAGRIRRDEWLLKLPALGALVQKYEATRFTRSMGTLLGNGVPIVMALRIAADTMSNHKLRAGMAGVAPAIKQGGRLADALQATGLFTPLALNMVRLGEETGRLDAMLLELARVHDGEVETGIKRMLALLEPALILVLGAMIAAIIVSILLGILSVNELAG